jgi:hypothetical protein
MYPHNEWKPYTLPISGNLKIKNCEMPLRSPSSDVSNSLLPLCPVVPSSSTAANRTLNSLLLNPMRYPQRVALWVISYYMDTVATTSPVRPLRPPPPPPCSFHCRPTSKQRAFLTCTQPRPAPPGAECPGAHLLLVVTRRRPPYLQRSCVDSL